jgi:hypothetical protein
MIMAERWTTQAQAPPQAGRARRRATRSPTVKLARLSALTGILFAALFVLAWSLFIRRPTVVVFIRAGRVAQPAVSERQSA